MTTHPIRRCTKKILSLFPTTLALYGAGPGCRPRAVIRPGPHRSVLMLGNSPFEPRAPLPVLGAPVCVGRAVKTNQLWGRRGWLGARTAARAGSVSMPAARATAHLSRQFLHDTR